MENNDLLYKILEFTKDGYDSEDLEGHTELRFFFLNNLYDEISLKEKEINYIELYLTFVEVGIFEYNWDTVPFSIVYEKFEGVNCMRCCLNLSFYHLDEWFAIYLGFKVTEKIPELALQINNNDGDPILIELADNLPNWIKPYNSKNRCFLLNGKIHLISPNLMNNKFKNIELKFALEILKYKLEDCQTNDLYNSLFMNKFESISRVNEKEKTHNFSVILPKKIAYFILKYHYLLVTSLKYLLNNSFDLREIADLEKKCNLEEDINLFFPESLIRVRICMTRTQYSRFVNEALLIRLPIRFSKKNWLKNFSENLINNRLEKEVHYGILITYGLYLAYIYNPEDCLNIFIWKYIKNEFWKFKEFPEIKQESTNFVKEMNLLKEKDFQTIWKSLNMRFEDLNNDFDFYFSNFGINSEISDDPIDWLNNEEYSKKLVEEIQGIYSNDLLINKKETKFTEFLDKESNFEGIEFISENDQFETYSDSNDGSDYSIDTNYSDKDLDGLHEIMNKMDDELRRTLKTTIPALNTVEETKNFTESIYNDSLKLENSLGIIGPATVFKELSK